MDAKRAGRVHILMSSNLTKHYFASLSRTFKTEAAEEMVRLYVNSRDRNAILGLEVVDLSNTKGNKDETLRQLTEHLQI
jgi:hypothetical protein